jgi:hypothetical protein
LRNSERGGAGGPAAGATTAEERASLRGEQRLSRRAAPRACHMSADVPPLVRLNWRGGLPLLVEARAEDFDERGAPGVQFTFASRQSYLAHALAGAVAQLRARSVVPRARQRVWFAHAADGAVLRWQLPLGALFDAHAAQGALPWRIVVHLSEPSTPAAHAARERETGGMAGGETGGESGGETGGEAGGEAGETARVPPASRVLACPDLDTIKRDFFHWFKQGMYLRFDSRLPFAEFRDNDDDMLWEGVAGGSIDRFWAVSQRMAGFEPKALPLRLLYLARSDPLALAPSADGQQPVLICKQLSVTTAEGAALTARALTARELPGLALLGDEAGLGARGPRLLCQGIAVPLDAPLDTLYASLAHPDMFLYLCVFA